MAEDITQALGADAVIRRMLDKNLMTWTILFSATVEILEFTAVWKWKQVPAI
jgi:hypothetical protein